MDDDVAQAANYRQIDKLTLQHLQKSRAMSMSMVMASFSMDKANVRGLDLSNGIMAMPSNEALELLPQEFECVVVCVFDRLVERLFA